MKGLFVTGTDTGVGKTWVTTQLIHLLTGQGQDVEPRKPVESGWLDEKGSDAWQLAEAANKTAKLDQICPNRFKVAVSPDIAAEKEGISITIESIFQQCIEGRKENQLLIVEGAGGFYSPLCSDGLNADLAIKLKLPVLLVVANRLGCINHTLLSLKAIQASNLAVFGIVLNDLGNLSNVDQMNNEEALKKLTTLPVFCTDNRTASALNGHSFDELASRLQ